MKTIIAGSRDGVSYERVCEAMKATGVDVSEVVSGACRGVDTHGEKWAAENYLPVKRFPADWATYGNAAGPIRNRQMANYAEALVAIWDGTSRGTRNMIEEAKKRGIVVYVYPSTGVLNGTR